MKRKLLLAALFVVSALGFNAKAQTWTAPAVPGTDLSELKGSDINVGMYNVQADAFTTRAMTYSTQAAATKLHGSDNQTESYSNRHHVRVVAGNNSTVKFNFPCIDNTSKWLGDGAQGTERIVYTDNGSQNYEFIPTEVSGKDNVYTLKVATATSDENAFLDVWQPYGGQLTYANGQGFTEWAFIKFSDIENGKYKLYKAKKAMYEIYSAVVAAGLETNYSDALATANTAYVAEDATFESVTAATNALIKAVSPALTKGYVNANALFTNPDMRGAGSKADWTDGYTDISWGVFENFHGYQGNKTLQQKQTELPNGFYKVVYHGIWRQDGSDAGPKLTLSSDNGSSTSADVPEIKTIDWGVGNTTNNNWTNANGKIVPNGMQSAGEGFSNGGAQVTIADFVVSDGTLTITVSTNSNSQWLIAQGFDIYYKAESLEEYANVFTSAKSEAEAIDQTKLNEYAKGVLVTALSNAATEQVNKEWYQARTAELKNAVELAKAIVPVYPSAKELIALCEKYSENSTPNSEDIKNTFDGNIATAKTDVESAQTVETLTNAIAALESARQTYVQNAYPTNDVTFDLTFKIVNAQVTSKDGWTNGRIHSGEQYTGAPDNTYLDNWNAEANNIKQEVGLPKGVYQLKAATRAGSNVTVGNIYLLDQATENNFSKDIHKVGNSGNVLGNGWDWTVVDNIILEGESNTVTVGFYSETSGGKWAGADNFTLTLIAKETEFPYILVEGNMEEVVATAQTDAETAFINNKTVENYNALITAINNAQASVDAYASAAKYFPKMKAALENTNLYTQEAYDGVYGTWLAAYNENTLETSIAATLTENSAYSAGWHSENKIDDILLSTWTVGGEAAYNYDKALYINTWSVEGDNDGTNFKVPFFEYWTGDDKSLGATTLTATVTGLEVGKKYTAKVWARVRIKNGASDPTGITFSVGNGTPVDITAGAQVGTSQFYIAEFVAVGNTDAEGNLTINFNIAADNNISWLSFKNVKYEVGEEPASAEDYANLTATIATAEGKTIGFMAGEYAPYNNIEVVKALAAAKLIDVTAINPKDDVKAAIASIAEDKWTINAKEVNAVYDGSFNLTTLKSGSYIIPTGWTNVGYNTRVYNSSNMGDNTGVNATSQAACMFAKFTTEYGTEEGYTMPLKAGVYTLDFIYGGWNEKGTRVIKIYNADNNAEITPNSVTAKDNQAHKKTESWAQYSGIFEIPADGNYILSFYRENTSNQNQICISDIEIFRAPEVSVEMNISDAKYSTFIAPFGVTIPEGVTASKVTGETNGVLTLETVETTIPANTPVVLYSETKYNSTFTGIDLSTKDSYTDGLLTGVYNATDVQLGWYVLQNNSGKVGFYRVDTDAITTVGANRCYLTIPAGSEAKAFFFGGEATGINAIEALQNGDAEIYTINGTRVNTLQKGVNIIKMSNGKTQKVLVK